MDTLVKRRGRPPGSRTRPALEREPRLAPPASTPLADYRHTDINAMCARQLSMLDWAQQAMRNEMQRAMQSKGEHIQAVDIDKLVQLSNGLVRAIDAMKKSSDLGDELAKRLTAEQLLEAAIKKVEGQDIATLNYAIKRLRAHRERIAPIDGLAKMQLGEPATAAGAIASLMDE